MDDWLWRSQSVRSPIGRREQTGGPMHLPDLDRLRRLPLATGVILLTWSLAGVTLDSPSRVVPLGIPLVITRPELLPAGLALAAFYGAIRYHYYALMLALSPFRSRQDILDQLSSGKSTASRKIHSYWGPREFESSTSYSDPAPAQSAADAVAAAFPKFARGRVRSWLRPGFDVDEHGDEYTSWTVATVIPRRCRLAALFQDFDYAAPVWFPSLAIAAYVLRTFGPAAA